MAKPTMGQILTDIERDIEAEFLNRSVHDSRAASFAPPRMSAPSLSMPDYVEHNDGATEIGKLSAEAVVREYEAAAKEIEAVGAELIERVRQCEAMTRDSLAVIHELKDTAARYREEAKRIFAEIENCSLMTSEIRKTCVDLKEKIATSAATEIVKLPKSKATKTA